MKTRTIEQDEQGKYYALDAVTILYKDMDGRDITIYMNPNSLYSTVRRGIESITKTSETSQDAGLTEEMSALKKQINRIVKASVKGLLMVAGDSLLTLFYGTKNHPMLPKDKSIDMIDWYTDQFTRIFIANMMRSDLVLEGQYTDVNVVEVSAVSTRPITAVEKTTTAASDGA